MQSWDQDSGERIGGGDQLARPPRHRFQTQIAIDSGPEHSQCQGKKLVQAPAPCPGSVVRYLCSHQVMPLVPSNVPSPTQQSSMPSPSQSCQVPGNASSNRGSLGSQLSLRPSPHIGKLTTRQAASNHAIPKARHPVAPHSQGAVAGTRQPRQEGRSRAGGTQRHSGKQSQGMSQPLDTLRPFFFFQTFQSVNHDI